MNRGYHLGRQILARALAAALYDHGWKDPINQWTMLAIILAESNGREEAVNFNLATLESRPAESLVLLWDETKAAHPPALGAPFDYATLSAGVLCEIVQPELGKLRMVRSDVPVQMSSSGLVVTSVDIGLVQRNVPPEDYRSQRAKQLRTLGGNLAEGRALYLESKFQPWGASVDRALNPADPGRHAHRAAAGIGNWLAERADLTPLPLLAQRS